MNQHYIYNESIKSSDLKTNYTLFFVFPKNLKAQISFINKIDTIIFEISRAIEWYQIILFNPYLFLAISFSLNFKKNHNQKYMC